MAKETSSGSQSVERALTVLRAFTERRPELRVGEIEAITELSQPTVSRMLAALEAEGLVERDPRSGLVRPGLGLATMSSVALNCSPIHREARQTAQSLACGTGLGANVAMQQGSEILYLAHFEGHLSPRSYTMVGRRSPMYATALGKAILADLQRGEIAELIPAASRERYTPNTLVDDDPLIDELARARTHGYALEIEELALGRSCIAAPIRNRRGRAVAALSLSGPASVLDLEARESELGRLVLERADAISIGLGYMVEAGHFR